MASMPTTPTPGEYVPFTKSLEHDQIQPLLVGHLISFTLFGIGMIQFYYVFCQLDTLRKTGNLCATDLFQVVMIALLLMSDIADAVIKGIFFDDLVRESLVTGEAAMTYFPKTIFGLCLMDGWITALTHLIYSVRIVRINRTKGWWIWAAAIFAMAISIVQFVGSALTGVHAWGPSQQWESTMKISAKLWLGGASLCDWFLCIAFCISLSQHRSGFKGTDYIITRWITFTLETGILTSVLQALDLILFLCFQQKPYHMVCAIILPKIYVISILMLLHSVYNNRINRVDAETSSMGSPTAAVGHNNNNIRTQFGGIGAPGVGPVGRGGAIVMTKRNQNASMVQGVKITSETHTNRQDTLNLSALIEAGALDNSLEKGYVHPYADPDASYNQDREKEYQDREKEY